MPIETAYGPPDAFQVTPTPPGPGTFTIGIGRMYVDGLLVECHGLGPQIYDEILGELRGTEEPPYIDQPYFPSPLPPSIDGASIIGRTDLVYIVAWQREPSSR